MRLFYQRARSCRLHSYHPPIRLPRPNHSTDPTSLRSSSSRRSILRTHRLLRSYENPETRTLHHIFHLTRNHRIFTLDHVLDHSKDQICSSVLDSDGGVRLWTDRTVVGYGECCSRYCKSSHCCRRHWFWKRWFGRRCKSRLNS